MVVRTAMNANRPSLLNEFKRRHVYRVGVAYAIAAWVLLQLAATVFPTFGAPAWVLKVITAALVIGFPIALILAWAFEMTPDGVRRTESAHSPDARSPEQTHRVGRMLNAVILGVLSLAVAVLVWRQFLYVPKLALHVAPRAPVVAVTTVAAPAKSIAVLPLANESGDPEQDYFSDGLSEALISALTQVHDLKVIGRNSSFQFRGKQQDDNAGIGRKLGVATLLEGTVRKEGGQVRIVASLIKADDGSALWSQTYDRQLKDVFAVQSDIATAVTSALKSTLLGKISEFSDKPPSGNLAAYNALLQGNFYFEHRSAEDRHKAIDFYDEAIRLDQRYALVYAKRSFAWRALADQVLGGAAQVQAYAKAREDARTALTLAPDLAHAHVALGWVVMNADFNFAAAEVEFRRAVELAPTDADAKNGLAGLLGDLGRLDEAIDLTRQALAIDPLHAAWYSNLTLYLIPLGRLDEAEQAARKAIALQPTASVNHLMLAIISIQRGQPEAALQAAQQEGEGIWRRYALALAQQARGDHAAADAALQKLIAKDAITSPFQIAAVYAFRKQPDQAFAWMDRAWAVRDPGVTELLYDPFLLQYKHDPRFAAFCRKVGLPVPPTAAGPSTSTAAPKPAEPGKRS